MPFVTFHLHRTGGRLGGSSHCHTKPEPLKDSRVPCLLQGAACHWERNLVTYKLLPRSFQGCSRQAPRPSPPGLASVACSRELDPGDQGDSSSGPFSWRGGIESGQPEFLSTQHPVREHSWLVAGSNTCLTHDAFLARSEQQSPARPGRGRSSDGLLSGRWSQFSFQNLSQPKSVKFKSQETESSWPSLAPRPTLVGGGRGIAHPECSPP